jgi:hypothetical protein
LENSKFSPKVIRNVAQNILSFLKTNATKAGHTYWLFKGRNDEVVKLYDLTTLCGNEGGNCEDETTTSESRNNAPEGENNPFTVPVAMLLYTVAKNMKNSMKKIGSQQAGAIKTLLENCIKLLPKEKYPQIVSSSHYILSDLYIPAGIDPSDPKFDVKSDDLDKSSIFDSNQISNSNSNSSSDDELEPENVGDKSLVLGDKSLVLATKSIKDTTKENKLAAGWKSNISPPPLTGDVVERCEKGLIHISEGLHCLQFFDSANEDDKKKSPAAQEPHTTTEKEQIIHEELHPNMAKPFQPIPLPYKQQEPNPLNADDPIPMGWNTPTTSKGQSKRQKKREVELESDDAKKLLIKTTSGVVKSWNIHLKVLLFEKACLIYATLAENAIAEDRFGDALRHIYAAVRSQQVVTMYVQGVAGSQSSCLLGRAGDIFCQFAKKTENMKRYLEEYHEVTEIDELIENELAKDIKVHVETELPAPLDNCEKSFIASCAFYEVAIKTASEGSKTELVRRLASVWNELGLKYMFWAQDEYQKCFDVIVEQSKMEKKWNSEKIDQSKLKTFLKFINSVY